MFGLQKIIEQKWNITIMNHTWKQASRVYKKIKRIIRFIKDRYIYWCFSYCGDRKKALDRLKGTLGELALHGRRLVGFYGECHMNVYTNILCNSKQFRNKYLSINAHEIEYLGKWHAKYVKKKCAWDKVNILIYNPGIPERDDIPSLETVLKWISENAKRIEVTNAAFKGYMPQHTEKVDRRSRCFIWGDKNINKAIAEQLPVVDVIKDLCRDDYYTIDYVKKFFDKSINMMSKYEQRCTVRISDYVDEQGRERILYHSVTHPNLEIMTELTKRIGAELEIIIDEKLIGGRNMFNNYDLTSHGEAVYPSIYKGLGIAENWEDRKIYPGDKRDKALTFAEYIESYMENANASYRTKGGNSHVEE